MTSVSAMRATDIVSQSAKGAGTRRKLRHHAAMLGLMVAITLAARGANLGNPDYHADESFYLLVGSAMHQGAIPYVDIWDRKPPGLFVFFWLLSGIAPSVLSYQIAAIGFVAATAVVVSRLASRWSGRLGAVLAGATYIAWLQPLLGGGGNAPVFYNLFVASAVLLLVRRIEQREASINLAEAGLAALLCGVAVSFKPTAVFEGAFVVLAFVIIEWRRTQNWRRAAFVLAITGMAASLPMLAAVLWYALQGDLATFVQATVLSSFHKTGANPAVFWVAVRYLAALTFLLVASAALGCNSWLETRRNGDFAALMFWWLGASIAGFLAVPNFYSHYALPLVPVLAVFSAPFLDKRPVGQVLASLSIGWALVLGQSFQFTQAAQVKEQFERVVAVAKANMPTKTLYVFDGSPWLYAATGAVLPTRFVFPEHLMMRTEASAIGVDPLKELAAVLSRRPDVIVVADFPRPDGNPAAFALLRGSLRRDYTAVCRLRGRTFEHAYLVTIFARSRLPDRRACQVPDPPKSRIRRL